jgi:site-specific DNA-methyltransferase (adenine-specific)
MLGDCLELMKEIPSGSIDLILCDLPYGTTSCKWDHVIDPVRMWEQYRRICAGAIVLTATQPFTSALVMSNLEMFKYCWVWEKSRPGDIFNAKNKPLKAHEDICVFSSGTTANGSDRKMLYLPQGVGAGGVKTNNPDEKEYAFKGKRPSHLANHVTHGSGYPRSVIQFANPNKGSVHPTQKPVALMEYLIKTYTRDGMTVLDNCMGSGTTGVACANTGRKFIGIEKDEAYFEIAKKRISDASLALPAQSIASAEYAEPCPQ